MLHGKGLKKVNNVHWYEHTMCDGGPMWLKFVLTAWGLLFNAPWHKTMLGYIFFLFKFNVKNREKIVIFFSFTFCFLFCFCYFLKFPIQRYFKNKGDKALNYTSVNMETRRMFSSHHAIDSWRISNAMIVSTQSFSRWHDKHPAFHQHCKTVSIALLRKHH